MNEEPNNWIMVKPDAYKIPKVNPEEVLPPIKGKYIPGLTPGKKILGFFIECFLAHLWCAYAMALCLSWIVRREVGCVCVEHNYPKMWMD